MATLKNTTINNTGYFGIPAGPTNKHHLLYSSKYNKIKKMINNSNIW